jgi:hypothetical protein
VQTRPKITIDSIAPQNKISVFPHTLDVVFGFTKLRLCYRHKFRCLKDEGERMRFPHSHSIYYSFQYYYAFVSMLQYFLY